MSQKPCLCGADADIKSETRTTADGRTETLYWVSCPVCGQLGPKVSDLDKGEQAAIAEARAAWDAKLVAARPGW